MRISLSFKAIMILSGLLLHPTSVFAQDDCTADIIIKADIKNMIVYIDNDFTGEGDSIKTRLPKGEHVISVTENSDRWNARTFIDTIRITNCDELILQYSFRNEVYLNSEPQDAEVYLSDSLIGYTPVILNRGINKVTLRKEGFEEVSFTPGSAQTENVKLKFTGLPEEESFFNKPVFKILVGSIVILGGVTAYYKLKADEKYDEYKITGNQKLLDETNKYDWISGISFGLVQINFGILIYHFLAE